MSAPPGRTCPSDCLPRQGLLFSPSGSLLCPAGRQLSAAAACYPRLLLEAGDELGLFGLPQEQNLRPEMRCLTAAKLDLWEESLKNYNLCGDQDKAATVNFHLGSNELRLDQPHNFHCLMNLTVWRFGAAEEANTVFPKQ